MNSAETMEFWVKDQGLLLVNDFAREIVREWKAWLTGSAPMAGLAVGSLVNPVWTQLPLWAWAFLIFVAGLVSAMFCVYRELRRERDTLRRALGGAGATGPFILVPYAVGRGARTEPSPTEAAINDV